VIASDGAASHPNSPTHTPEELAIRRRHELTAAMALLAPAASVCWLGLPDGSLAGRVDDIVGALSAVLGDDTDVWLLSTARKDGHPDHTACGLAAQRVAAPRTRTRWWEYPVWLWHAGDPAALRTRLSRDVRRFALSAENQAARAGALRAFASQVLPLSSEPGDEAVLPPAVLVHADRNQDLLLEPGGRPAESRQYFTALYAGAGDPWSFRSSWYEQRKRAVLLAALPRQRFRRTFEPGCALGDLSLLLADRSDCLVATEWAEQPLQVARHRLAESDGAQVQHGRIPQDWPGGRFDLIVLSELAYYVLDLHLLARRTLACLDDDGVVVLVHWRRTAPDHPHTAETVHLALRAALQLPVLVRHDEDDFLLDVLARDPRSVATRDQAR
jgi:LmbE family N-acetylglucosaminyl deacetylase